MLFPRGWRCGHTGPWGPGVHAERGMGGKRPTRAEPRPGPPWGDRRHVSGEHGGFRTTGRVLLLNLGSGHGNADVVICCDTRHASVSEASAGLVHGEQVQNGLPGAQTLPKTPLRLVAGWEGGLWPRSGQGNVGDARTQAAWAPVCRPSHATLPSFTNWTLMPTVPLGNHRSRTAEPLSALNNYPAWNLGHLPP